MATLAELSRRERLFVTGYPWRRLKPMPWSRPARPLSESRLALISTGGMVMPGQEPFSQQLRGGDSSFRVIPADADPATLQLTHKSGAFDRSGILADANLAFPLDRLRERVIDGTIGNLAPRHLSFMGSITAPRRLIKETAPAAAAVLVNDGVEVALLVPV